MSVSIDFNKIDVQISILQDELNQVAYILDLLQKLQLQDNMNGNINRDILLQQVHVIKEQKKYILNRKTFLENTKNRFFTTALDVSKKIDDAMSVLLSNG